MKKFIFLIIFIVGASEALFSQSIDELQKINAKAMTPFVTPDVLDRLMIGLRTYENSELLGQDSLMFDTYRKIADAYLSNNHFKRAYEVYNTYLEYKEKALSKQKMQIIQTAHKSVSVRKSVASAEEVELANRVNALHSGNNSLEVKIGTFKKYFSFALIFLSAAFAIILVTAGIKMFSLRAQLRQNREKMKEIHRIAVVGQFAEGLKLSLMSDVNTVGTELENLHGSLKSINTEFEPALQAKNEIVKIEKIWKEII